MIVILGGRGYIGHSLQRALLRSDLPFQLVSRRTVDYTHPEWLRGFLRECHADFVINAAGYVGQPNIDTCEVNKSECLNANTGLPGTIRSVCEQLQIPWGHVSSGCIYTGSRTDGSAFTEMDAPNFSFRHNNCSFYSGCKAMAEEILADAEQCYIWRPRMPFNHIDSPRNYISKVLQYEMLLDATNSLTHLDEFADACVACWKNRVPFGIYNLTNPGRVTTRQVVSLIQKYRLTKKQFCYFDSEQHFMATAAKAPRSNCILDCTKAIAAGLKLTNVHEALERSIRNWQALA
jgi:dTDP-4-dehydrorhamnose reductase